MDELRRKPMPLYSRMDSYNNNNEHEYDPYVIAEDGHTLIIDPTWWQSLTPGMQRQIQSRTSFELREVTVPHPSHPYTNDKLGIVYRAYLEGFDYQHWYSTGIPNGPRNAILLQISTVAKKELSARQPSVGVDALRQQLLNVCDGKEFFVRLSGTSGKNEKAVRPFKNAEDIIKHLMSVELFRPREFDRDKDTFIILIPWNESIDPRCEFRIFVVNGKLTAASPQRYWELHQHSSEELEAFEHALKNIEFIGTSIPYSTFVADVYIDVASSTCHLIELNPFGAHCGAGASFFNWIDDYAVLYGQAPPELRYLSAINY